MTKIAVVVISSKGFTKEVYKFNAVNWGLEYTSYSEYHRSHLDEPWGDEWPVPDEKAWREKHSYLYSCSCGEEDAWNKYRRRFNPVTSYPVGGKEGLYTRACGQAGFGLRESKPLPKGVAGKVKRLLIKNMQVE